MEQTESQTSSTVEQTGPKHKPLPYIKFDELPKPDFPTEYFGYVYYCEDYGNMYSASKLSRSIVSSNARFLNKKSNRFFLQNYLNPPYLINSLLIILNFCFLYKEKN